MDIPSSSESYKMTLLEDRLDTTLSSSSSSLSSCSSSFATYASDSSSDAGGDSSAAQRERLARVERRTKWLVVSDASWPRGSGVVMGWSDDVSTDVA